MLERLQHAPVQPVHAFELGFEVFELPARERRRVVEHRPVRAREVVHEEVHALARQVARELVHRHELGMDVGPELLLALRQLPSALAIDRGIARHRQRMERLPRERRAQRGIEREQLEQDRRAGARRPDDEQRRVDRLGADRGRRVPRRLQPQPGLEHPQHLAACHDPADEVQLRLAVDRREEPPVRLVPARPVVVAEVVEAGRRAREVEQLVRVEAHDPRRIARRLAEQVDPPDPVGVRQLLHPRSLASTRLDALTPTAGPARRPVRLPSCRSNATANGATSENVAPSAFATCVGS